MREMRELTSVNAQEQGGVELRLIIYSVCDGESCYPLKPRKSGSSHPVNPLH